MAAAASNAVYAYDAAGRMVGVTDPAGETARYRYDAAGNRLGIDRFPSDDLSVLSLVPVRAAAGATVTVSGTGFSTTPASNVVSFGGTAAQVLTASATHLEVRVPAGASDGKVSVTEGTLSAQSAESFTLASSGPTVSGFAPLTGAPGTEVKLTGTGFAAVLTDNVVRFGGGAVAQVTARTDTSLTVSVPPRAQTGPVEVATPDGRGVSSSRFTAASSGESAFETTVLTSVTDGTPPTVAVTTPGNRAKVLFDAERGSDVSFGVTASTFNAGLSATLLDPSGARVELSGAVGATGGDWDARSLPLAGRYSLIITPGSGNIGAATVTLSEPVGGVLDFTAGPAATVLNRPGQDGRWGFTATAGQSLSVGLDATGLTKGVAARLFGPDGSQVPGFGGSLSAGAVGSFDADVLPAGGAYSLVLDPDDAGTGTIKVTGSTYAQAGALDPSGPELKLPIVRPGQNGLARFEAAAGQRVQLGMKSEGFTERVDVAVRRPDGSPFGSFTVSPGGSTEWDSPALPVAGTYSVSVAPYKNSTGSLTVQLSSSLGVAQLSTAGEPVAVDVQRFGQNAESAFQAGPGDDLTLAVTGNTFSSWNDVTVVAPSGKTVESGLVPPGSASTIALVDLPEQGTYTVVVDPRDGAVGKLALTLSADLAAPLVVNGAPSAISVKRAGQQIRGTFTATTGDNLTLAVTANTYAAYTYATITTPTGKKITDKQAVLPRNTKTIGLNGLPESGTYTVLLSNNDGALGDLTLTLSTDLTTPLALNGAPSAISVKRAGQQIRGTFTATTGDNLTLAVTANTYAAYTYATITTPTGKKITDKQAVLPRNTKTIGLNGLPESGTYTVLLSNNDGALGDLTLTLSTDLTTPLALNGAPSAISVKRAGQQIRGTFTATTGDNLTLAVTANTYAAYTYATITTPTGKKITDKQAVLPRNTKTIGLNGLPESGTYTVLLSNNDGALGDLTLTLSTDLTTPLTLNGTPSAVSVKRAGQRIRGTFTAKSGDNLAFAITANTYAAYTYATITTPTGKRITDAHAVLPRSSGSISLPKLPESGTYTVLLENRVGAVGDVTLALSGVAATRAALTADGGSTVVPVRRPGGSVRAEFVAPAASLGVAITGNTLARGATVRLAGPGGKSVVLGSVSRMADRTFYLSRLAPGASYALVVEPERDATGSITLWLSRPVRAGSLTAAAPTAAAEVTRPGQELVFTHTAAVGSGATVRFGGTLAGSPDVTVLTPDGTAAGETTTLAGGTAVADLGGRLKAGEYQVRVRPERALAAGRAEAALVPEAAGGPLTLGGPQRAVSLSSAAQYGRYSLAGSRGQRLSLSFQAPGAGAYLSLAAPNGTSLLHRFLVPASARNHRLPALPADGTYTITVALKGEAAGTVRLGIESAEKKAPEADSPLADRPAATQQPAVVPSGPDAWQPGRANLQGRDWVTSRGQASKAPAGLRAPPGATALTGRVLKLDGKPLAQVTVKAGTQHTRTDAQGRFLLAGVAATVTTLVVDGQSANSAARQYGRFDIHVSLRPGRTTELGFPVWMTPLDTKHVVKFDAPAKTEVVLKSPSIPGLEVRIPQGSVVRDESGKPVTELGITAIPIDRPPFPLPKNGVVPVYFTVQPGGTYVFPKGAQVIYPNYTREAPGTQVEFMDYDPKKKGWYVYGQGRVSADGRQVVPDVKTRVWAFHGAMFNISDLVPWDLPWLKDIVDWLSGDPVELGTGMLTDSHTDLAVADPLGSAEVARTYWQGDTRKRAFGIGRDLTYNAFLHSQQQYKEVDLYLPGGSKVHFVRTSPGSGWSDAVFEPTDTPSQFHGSKIVSNNGQWDLRFRDGTVWVFPQYAALKEVRDRHGNTLTLTRLDNNKGEVTRIDTPGGRWINFAYDAEHRVKSATDNTGRTASYGYDTAGRLKTVTDAAGKASTYDYDGISNRVAKATDARGIAYMSNTFHSDGRVKEQTLTEGAKYSFAYGKAGTGTFTEVTEPNGAVRRVEFDSAGYGVKETQAHGSSLARSTSYTRGPYHRIDAVTDPYNRRIDLTYDTNGYITQTTELAGTPKARTSGTAQYDGPFDQPTRVTDPLGNATTFTYDPGGNLESVKDPENRITRVTHNAQGQPDSITDPSGAVTEQTYTRGEPTSSKDAEGRVRTQFTDAAGRSSSFTDSVGARTTLLYDALNQTREVTDPLGHTTTLGYDANGNIETLTDARSNTTTWSYDQADRPLTATDPLGGKALFEYWPSGQAKKVTSRAGLIATSQFDLLGRAKATQYGVRPDGTSESTALYEYDAVDLPKGIADSQAGTRSFTYDDYDRLRSDTGPTGTVTYDYDGADRRKEMTAGGITTTYGYDPSSILTSVKSGTQQVTFGLDETGRETTASYPGGITRTTGYDKTGITKSLTYTQGTKNIGDLTYTRDTRGLQSALSGTLASIALPAPEAGNAVFDKDNRLTTLGGRSFTYDTDGQLKTDGQRTYTWNARGQLSSLTESAGNKTSLLTYDPLGTRTAKTTDGATRKFLTDGSNPAVEQDSAGQTTATVATSGLDQYLTRTEKGATQVYLTDALGTVAALANTDGTIATRYTYDPNGKPTTTGSATANPYTFTGREDDGTGLLYYRNRYYDPQTGRFISQDPIGHAGGTNLYQYALSSPTTYTDPSGNSPLLVGCVVGGLTNGALDWGIQRLSGRKVNWGQVGGSAAVGCMSGMLPLGPGSQPALLRPAATGGVGKRLPMTMECVCRIAAKYKVPIDGLVIRINKAKDGFAGSTGPNGAITLTRAAFRSEEQLARTLAHERHHVEQLRRGMGYPEGYDATNRWEETAIAFENWWWEHMGKNLQ